jgi:hypothetical protein
LLLSITIDTSTPPSLAFIHSLGFLEGEAGGRGGRRGRRGGGGTGGEEGEKKKKIPADFNSQPKSQWRPFS